MPSFICLQHRETFAPHPLAPSPPAGERGNSKPESSFVPARQVARSLAITTASR